jgi:hypothetical protein
VRTQVLRHLAAAENKLKDDKPSELSWRDYLVMLLSIAAEIEHGLMVEYLYAAYSLGGDQVPAGERERVQGWRDTILTVAREEMGHLLCVQNLLILLGGPLNFEREDYPWDTPFYPFPFTLEPVTLESIACYVFAEMPLEIPRGERARETYRHFMKHDKAKIQRIVDQRSAQDQPHRVGEIYDAILTLIQNEDRVPDTCFDGSTYQFQASWDDWARRYGHPPRRLDAEGSLEDDQPDRSGGHVIVGRAATRTQAVRLLQAVSGQGEAPHLGRGEAEEPSHFDRFLGVYQGLEQIAGYTPARDVPKNPTTITPEGKPTFALAPSAAESPALLTAIRASTAGQESSFISSKRSQLWAHLFNVRYRMLLSYLAHTFRLARAGSPGVPDVRAAAMHRAFGEMYNLKTIAGILMRLPLSDAAPLPGEPRFAGPTFEMPYTVRLPFADADCWRLHKDLLQSAADLSGKLIEDDPSEGKDYLSSLQALDKQTRRWLDAMLAGQTAPGRYAR